MDLLERFQRSDVHAAPWSRRRLARSPFICGVKEIGVVVGRYVNKRKRGMIKNLPECIADVGGEWLLSDFFSSFLAAYPVENLRE